jgi:two-component system, OmpR family, sensor histidine kinase KdpD
LLCDEFELDVRDARDLAATIDQETDRLTRMLQHLLDLRRVETGSATPSLVATDVAAVVSATLDELGPAAGRVAVEIPASLPPAIADWGLLERALANVVRNALTWSPPGAAVGVAAGATGGRIEIRVSDRGPGIPKEDRETVFAPFRRLADTAGGSPDGLGLGLAIARGFTRALGGDLHVEETPGGGATFVFSLRTLGRPS